MMDAVRLLPVIGMLLWLVPTLWSVPADDSADPVKMSKAIIYVFGVWVCLILSGALLWRYLVAGDGIPQPPDTDPAPDPE
jgi:hypothetical protein